MTIDSIPSKSGHLSGQNCPDYKGTVIIGTIKENKQLINRKPNLVSFA